LGGFKRRAPAKKGLVEQYFGRRIVCFHERFASSRDPHSHQGIVSKPVDEHATRSLGDCTSGASGTVNRGSGSSGICGDYAALYFAQPIVGFTTKALEREQIKKYATKWILSRKRQM
jgi:hypothetical protein